MAKLYAYIGHWNKTLQCFPVRITDGSHNLQWMTSDEIDAITIEYRTDFNHIAKVKTYCQENNVTVASL